VGRGLHALERVERLAAFAAWVVGLWAPMGYAPGRRDKMMPNGQSAPHEGKGYMAELLTIFAILLGWVAVIWGASQLWERPLGYLAGTARCSRSPQRQSARTRRRPRGWPTAKRVTSSVPAVPVVPAGGDIQRSSSFPNPIPLKRAKIGPIGHPP
jgi:hypothetical protein